MTDPLAQDFLRQNFESIKVIVAIDFSASNYLSSHSEDFPSLHSPGKINGKVAESPYRRILFYIASNLFRLDPCLEIELLNFDSKITKQKLIKGKDFIKQSLQTYDEWAAEFHSNMKNKSFDLTGTSITEIITHSIRKVNEAEEMTILLILTDGKLADPVREAHAICEAALHPLVISAIGITFDDEDPRFQSQFDNFYLLDDNIFDRVFDNFNFTPFVFNKSESQWWYSGVSEVSDCRLNQVQIDRFFDEIFAELPEQARLLADLKYFERDFERFRDIFEVEEVVKMDGNELQKSDVGKVFIPEEVSLQVGVDLGQM